MAFERKTRHLLIEGAVHIVLSEGKLMLSDDRGCILAIHNARAVVINHLDFDDMEFFGDLREEARLPC